MSLLFWFVSLFISYIYVRSLPSPTLAFSCVTSCRSFVRRWFSRVSSVSDSFLYSHYLLITSMTLPFLHPFRLNGKPMMTDPISDFELTEDTLNSFSSFSRVMWSNDYFVQWSHALELPQSCSIWPIDWALSGATTPSQSGPGSDGNEEELCVSQSSSIIRVSPSDCFMSYQGDSLEVGSYPSSERQSVYSTAPAYWTGNI